MHGLVVVARDVTQRRMWEVAGERHGALPAGRPARLVDHPAARPQRRVTSVNAAFTRLLGHDLSHVIGRHAGRRSATNDAASDLALAIEKAGTDRPPVSCEVTMRHARPRRCRRKPMRFEIVNLLDDPVVSRAWWSPPTTSANCTTPAARSSTSPATTPSPGSSTGRCCSTARARRRRAPCPRRSCSSTSTGSSRSTTCSATRRATNCCARSANASLGSCVRATWWPAWAATSS